MRFFLALVLSILASVPAMAQTEGQFRVLPESQFLLEGTSTLGAYSCASNQVRGEGAPRPDGQLAAEVRVPVAAFRCDNRQMTSDFRHALRGERYPEIRFRVHRARIMGPPDATGWARAEAEGSLVVAGQERSVTLPVAGQMLPDGKVRVRGEHPLRMTDFGITPPTALMGLVRAHDRLTVRFDLVAVP